MFAVLDLGGVDAHGSLRGLLPGRDGGEAGWESGLFDRNSFTEAQAGWARTVITGRARLGGIPVGVIAVETQTVQRVVPADPGMLDSSEQTLPQAGQVGKSGCSSWLCCIVHSPAALHWPRCM